MPWWVTIYNRRPIADMTPARLIDGITGGDGTALAGTDYYSLAEEYDIEDEGAVSAALGNLSVLSDGDGPLDVEVRYRPDARMRPIVVHHWREPSRVQEEIAEAFGVRDVPEDQRDAVAAATEVVGIELGVSQLSDMGLVIANEVARYVAQKGDGVIVDDDGHWFAIVDGGFRTVGRTRGPDDD